MTAAALKPELFGHLLASQPDRSDEKSLTPTILAVLFHATLLATAVWASMQLRAVARTTHAPDTVGVSIVPVAPPRAPSRGQPAPDRPGKSTGIGLTPPQTISIDIPPAQPGPVTSDFDVVPVAVPGVSEPGADSPTTRSAGLPMRDGFRIATTLPALLNASAVSRALERNYPPLLRDAGIGGKAVLWVLLNEDGSVARSELKESSGQAALDDVALKIAPLMRFSPAMNRDQRIKVWVSVPIVFRTN